MKVDVIVFEPFQRQLLNDTSPTTVVDGGVGTGKSFATAFKFYFLALLFSKANLLMVRKTRKSMVNSTVLMMETTVMVNDPCVLHQPSKSRFRFKNGSYMFYGGMANDDQIEQLRSIGSDGSIDGVWIEEAHLARKSDRDELVGRNRGTAIPFNLFIMTTNPAGYSHWINTHFILTGNCKRLNPAFGINPHNSKQYEKNMESLTGAKYERLVKGKWANQHGAVYDEFRPSRHVIPLGRLQDYIPDFSKVRIFRGIDFGYTNASVCLWGALLPDGTIIVYKEIYMSRLSNSDFAKKIREWNKGDSVEITAADWDAAARKELEQHGIPTIAANKESITGGIDKVRELMRGNPLTGRPRLMFYEGMLTEQDDMLDADKKPNSTLVELPDYHWMEAKSDSKNTPELPVDKNNHGCDALRYLCLLIDSGTSSEAMPLDEILEEATSGDYTEWITEESHWQTSEHYYEDYF